MHVFKELRRRAQSGAVIRVCVVGTGSMGRGIAMQLKAMEGMEPAILVNRTVSSAVDVWLALGSQRDEIVVSEDPRVLSIAVEQGLPCVCRDPLVAASVPEIEAVVESTGTIAPATMAVLGAIQCRKHVVVMNAELDATLGCYLAERARQQGVLYGYADGDQPGVLARILDWVCATGFEVVAAVNCKGFLDVSATPSSSMEWAAKMRTSARMICAFTDGTKMNLENAVVSNATGLVPDKRGMHGVVTSQKNAIKDFTSVLSRSGVVDYSLGGDFGGGVFVIGRSDDWERVGHYFDYLKMGRGPEYLFFRPYHLCHLEAPISVAETVLLGEPTLAPRGAPAAEVIAIAKRDLKPGTVLDGIGGFCAYGQIDTVERAREFLPIGLSENATLLQPVQRGEPIPRSAVERPEGDYVGYIRQLQDSLFTTFEPTKSHVLSAFD
jgi:predicted homoserine dehydrogenase-like protein